MNKNLKILFRIISPLWLALLVILWSFALLFLALTLILLISGVVSITAGILNAKTVNVDTGLLLFGISFVLIGISLVLSRPLVSMLRSFGRLSKYLFSCFKREEEVTE